MRPSTILTSWTRVRSCDGPSFVDILPSKYGVCRGFVVSEDGQKAGDDLIIFDRMQYPTLRSSVGLQFSVKDQIPIEAVYAHIECKHSIRSASTFDEAMQQVSAVKELLLRRQERKNPNYETDGPVYDGKVRDWPRTWPPRQDQPFTMIVARSWSGALPTPNTKVGHPPDAAILGEDHVLPRGWSLGPDGIKCALFHDDRHWAGLETDRLDGEAFGVGILMLLQALSWIELVPIDWAGSLNQAFWNSLAKK